MSTQAIGYLAYKKKLESLSPRDRQIWEFHNKATNALGFATQMAEQGAHNSQCRYEEKADAASSSLWELLIAGDPQTARADADDSLTGGKP